MKQERMKVLELLEAGKITAAEAKDLLDSIKKPEYEGHYFVFDEDTRENVEQKLSKFASHVEGFARDLGSKAQDVFKDVEPKVRKASQVVLEKTAAVFDEIAKSLNESLEHARKSAECCAGEEKESCCCEEAPADDNAPREN
jgi:DNA-directed RNA polymerase subunit F